MPQSICIRYRYHRSRNGNPLAVRAFSGSETALMAISRLRLRHLAEKKPRRAGIVERLLKKPEKLIGTILLGNNLVNVAMPAIATAVAISIWGERGIAYVVSAGCREH